MNKTLTDLGFKLIPCKCFFDLYKKEVIEVREYAVGKTTTELWRNDIKEFEGTLEEVIKKLKDE